MLGVRSQWLGKGGGAWPSPDPWPALVQEFLQRPGLQHDLPTFCQQHSYTALVAMTISFGERHEPHRQLAVYSPCARLRATVSTFRDLPPGPASSTLSSPLPVPQHSCPTPA